MKKTIPTKKKKQQKQSITIGQPLKTMVFTSSYSIYVQYSILFILTAIITFMPFLQASKSLVFAPDGISQHYNAFVYLGIWLRETVLNILHGNSNPLKMWEFGLGYGGDILGTLHYYAFGDPLNLISIVIRPRYAENVYGALIVFRLFLAGIAFMVYCRTVGKDGMPVVGGALLYAFCGFALIAIKHPFFINPMIYFPLLCIGIEKVLSFQKPTFFIVAIFISAVSNVYFFYMLAILTATYGIARIAMLSRGNHIEQPVKQVFLFLLYGLIGTLIAAAVILPVIYLLLGADRTSAELTFDMLYPLFYYKNLPFTYASISEPRYWAVLSFAAPALLIPPLLFSCKKRHFYLKLAFLALTIMMLIPLIGSVLNGFSYVTNRWIWSYSFFTAFTAVCLWQETNSFSVRQDTAVVLCLLGYFILTLLIKPDHFDRTLISIIIALFVFLLLKTLSNRRQLFNQRTASFVIVTAIVAGIGLNAYYEYSPSEDNYISSFVKATRAWSISRNSPTKIIADEHTLSNEFIRIEQENIPVKNTGDLFGISSTQSFWSLGSGYTTKYLRDLAVCVGRTDSNYYNLGGRAYLTSLASVTHYVEDSNYTPYNYAWKGYISQKTAGNRRLFFEKYENNQPMPLGYTYDSYLLEADWKKIAVPERQEALMQTVVLNNPPSSIAITQRNSESIETNIKAIDYTMDLDTTVLNPEEGVFIVGKRNSTVRLNFKGIKNSETYLFASGLDINFVSPYHLYTDDDDTLLSKAEFDSLDKKTRDRITNNSITYNNWQKNSCEIKLRSDCRESFISYTSSYSNRPTGWTNYLMNLGYYKYAQNYIDIIFPETGIYTFDTLKVMCLPLDDLDNLVSKRTEDVLENISISNNVVSGDIETAIDKMLCLSIPYSVGWTAKVDGEKQTLLHANGMFMALEIPAGMHTVELSYSTPGLLFGLVLSIAGWLTFALLAFLQKKRSAQQKELLTIVNNK